MSVPESLTEATIAQPAENPSFVQLREHSRKLEATLKEKEAELEQAKSLITQSERAKMDEMERIKAENADLAKKTSVVSDLQQRVAAQDAKFQALFEQELVTFPPDQQAKVQAIASQIGTPEGRYDALLNLKSFVPSVAPKPTGGSVTNPGLPGATANPVVPPAPSKPADWGNKSFLEAAQESRVIQTVNLDALAAASQKKQ